MNRPIYRSVFLLFLVSLVGIGCWNSKDGNHVIPLKDLSIEEVTNIATFKKDSTIQIQASAFEHEGDVYRGSMGVSTRNITIEDFTGESAKINWSHDKLIETESSKQERARYKDEHPGDESGPTPIYDITNAVGGLDSINFVTNHNIYLPVRWPEEFTGDRSNVIWISKDMYEEFTRTRTSTVYLNVLQAMDQLTTRYPALRETYEAFRAQELEASKKTDTDLMKVEGDTIEYSININDEEVKVQALRARNWFGEVIVLNNKMNPLILEFNFNPPIEGMESASAEMNTFKDLMSYKVTKLTVPRESVE